MRPSFRRSLMLIAFAAAAFGAVPVHGATKVITINAAVVKPLTLTWGQNLVLGTMVLAPGTWSGATVGISRAGVFTCTNSNVTCTGATQVAQYTVTGTNGQLVRISAPNVTLVKQGDASKTLTLVVDNPGTVNLPNSGNQGTNISLGGSITLNSNTADGVYRGTFNVTVDY